MSISYNPGIQFNGDQSIRAGAESMRQIGLSIADHIQKQQADMDEAKGYRMIGKAMANDPNNGIDPDSVDKMTLGQLRKLPVLASIIQMQAKDRQQEKGMTALLDQGQAVAESMPNTGAPSPDFMAALTGQGTNGARGPLANPPMTPAPNPLKVALLNAVKNKDLLFTKEGQDYFGNIIKEGSLQAANGNNETDNPIIEQALSNGNKGYRMPGSKQFQVVTTANTEAVAATNKEGKTLGYTVNGHWVPADKTSAGYFDMPDPENPVYGPRLRLSMDEMKKNYPELLERFIKSAPAAGTAATKTDITQSAYNTLKSGDKFWWQGKEHTKK